MAVARWIETDTNSNKDISAAVSIGAYTADADRMIVCDVSLDQVAGNGDYVVYITRQINGAGSAYVMLPKTTCAAASGETAIAMQSGPITVRSGDVVTCYVDGLAGDTATPDTTVRFFEMAALRPTTADRTLDVSAGGEAGVDWANVGSPTTTVGLSATTVKTATDIATLVGVAGAGLTAVPWNATWDAQVESEVADALEAAITDSIPADGSIPSVKQALYMIVQRLTEVGIVGTTLTVNKADGSTPLFTLTLGDATNPTTMTRAS